MFLFKVFFTFVAIVFLAAAGAAQNAPKFVFGVADTKGRSLAPTNVYSKEAGFGFEPGGVGFRFERGPDRDGCSRWGDDYRPYAPYRFAPSPWRW